MKIAMIDSDPVFLEQFAQMMRECLDTIGMAQCRIVTRTNGAAFAANEFEAGSFFLVFLDTHHSNSEKAEGIELAGKLRDMDADLPIVFVSSVNDYAMESYMVGAEYFTVKPMDREDCYRVLQRVLFRRCTKDWLLTLTYGFRCYLEEIIYIRQQRNACVLYMTDPQIGGGDASGREEQYYRGGITGEMLDRMIDVYHCFYRIDKETVINLWHVKGMEKRALRLSNGHYISVSKKQIEEIRKQQIRMQMMLQQEI
ncbi:MAG: response regulator [Eubacteriales bacterium]|nr:response regulator [Eubacteriales bacterium]